MASHTEEPPSPEAEEVFATFVEEAEQGTGPDIEELCARHLALAGDLRRLHASWKRIDAMLSGLADEAAASGIDEVAQRHAQEMVARLQRRIPHTTRYGIDDELARGGMSTVLRVRDHDLRRRLAMKVLRDHEHGVGSDVSRISRFVEEAQITGQLEHPGIVPVHDLGIDERGDLFFTMRLVEGRDLGEIFQLAGLEGTGWSRARVLGILLKVCEAISFAHSRGVVHRDLKPSNVMVGSFGETYVMDWGLARVLPGRSLDVRADGSSAAIRTTRHELQGVAYDPGLLSRSGEVVGTPSYMAPEQANADLPRTGPRSDVYSVGAMLYHFLSGVVPYVEGDERVGRGELLGRVRKGPPRKLSEVAPNAPPELAAICEKAMAREPERRYAGMGELAEDLHAFLDRRVVQAFETGAWAEFRKWVVRNRTAAAAIGLALVGVLGSLAGQSLVLARGKAELLLLSDTRLLLRLTEQAEGLWPPDPARIPAMDAWLADARTFVARRDAHVAALAGLAPDDGRRPAELLRSLAPLEEEELHSLRAVVANGPQVLGEAGRVEDPALREKLLEKFGTELPLARARLAELERRSSGEDVAPDFADDERGWQYESHAFLLAAIDAFTNPDPHAGWIAGVERSRELAAGLERSLEEHRVAWADAVAAIADPVRSPLYGGLEIEPQLGLVPLGPDPSSGLWEFGHLQSGEVPRRAEDGRLVLGPRSSIVLVLVPGGTFHMGAERIGPDACDGNMDPGSRFGEQPVHAVALAPFLLAKHETTQAQWLRATGENPSYYGVGFVLDDVEPPATATWIHPVEQVDWFRSLRVLERMGLTLPTEAQWEYAARAGTRTPYWSGAGAATLAGGANLQDCASWSDGLPMPAAVDSLRPNGFGLHHMTGNVWEWCRDPFNTSYLWPLRPGDGLRQAPYDDLRVVRGGAYSSSVAEARSAFRNDFHPALAVRELGCRAARPLQRSASE